MDCCVYKANFHRYVHNADTTDEDTFIAHGPEITRPTDRDYESLCSRFAWLPVNIIKCTFEVTTQYARLPHTTILKKRFKSPNLALNVHHCNEPVATDTIYWDVDSFLL